MFSITVLAFAAVVFVMTAPRVASAQNTCDPDAGVRNPNAGLVEQIFPGDNEDNVPTNGFIRLRYIERVAPNPFVSVIDVATGRPLAGRAWVVDNEVHWQSDSPLAPNTEYRVHFADLGSGDGNVSTFRTGFGPARDDPPVFAGITGVTAMRMGDVDLCGDPDAAEITVTYRRANDNGWPAMDIEYVVFQTRGPHIGGPVERARQRGSRTGSAFNTERSMSFRLSSENASAPVCFNIQAVDIYGRADGNRVEKCVNPAVGNFFAGCAVQRTPARASRGRAAGAALGGVLIAVGALVVFSLRRRSQH